MSKTKLTDKEVSHLAELAKLQIDTKHKEKIKIQLEETINYIQNLQELDTEDVKAADNITGTENVTFADGAANDRGLSQEEALSNTNDKKNGCFVVKRIL